MRIACVCIAIVLFILASLSVAIGHFAPGWLGLAFLALSMAVPN